MVERGGLIAPFRVGDRVTVPSRYRGLVVDACWQTSDVLTERVDGLSVRTVFPGGWRVRASFASGFGWYEGLAAEFAKEEDE